MSGHEISYSRLVVRKSDKNPDTHYKQYTQFYCNDTRSTLYYLSHKKHKKLACHFLKPGKLFYVLFFKRNPFVLFNCVTIADFIYTVIYYYDYPGRARVFGRFLSGIFF